MATIMQIMAAYIYFFTSVFVSVPMEIRKGTLLNIKDFASKKRIIKGTVQRDFLPPIFSQMDFSQAPYSVFKGFPN
jgi:hypothetical protein